MEVSITQLSKTYHPFRALDQITLNIPGSMFGMLGNNGAGKTTLHIFRKKLDENILLVEPTQLLL